MLNFQLWLAWGVDIYDYCWSQWMCVHSVYRLLHDFISQVITLPGQAQDSFRNSQEYISTALLYEIKRNNYDTSMCTPQTKIKFVTWSGKIDICWGKGRGGYPQLHHCILTNVWKLCLWFKAYFILSQLLPLDFYEGPPPSEIQMGIFSGFLLSTIFVVQTTW